MRNGDQDAVFQDAGCVVSAEEVFIRLQRAEELFRPGGSSFLTGDNRDEAELIREGKDIRNIRPKRDKKRL